MNSSIVLASGLVLVYAAAWKARNLATFVALGLSHSGWPPVARRRGAMVIALVEAVVGLLLLACGVGGPAIPDRVHLLGAMLLASTGFSLVAFHAFRRPPASARCGCMGSDDTVGVSRVRAGLLLLAGLAITFSTIAGANGDSLRTAPVAVLAATLVWVAVFVVGSEVAGLLSPRAASPGESHRRPRVPAASASINDRSRAT